LNNKEQMDRLPGQASEDCRREALEIIVAHGKALMLGGTELFGRSASPPAVLRLPPVILRHLSGVEASDAARFLEAEQQHGPLIHVRIPL